MIKRIEPLSFALGASVLYASAHAAPAKKTSSLPQVTAKQVATHICIDVDAGGSVGGMIADINRMYVDENAAAIDMRHALNHHDAFK
jgi:hypothetical protein